MLQQPERRPRDAIPYVLRWLVVLMAMAAVCGAPAAEPSPPTVNPTPNANGAAVPTIPDQYKLNMLIRTTLIALSQANQTGNYSVLRDLGTPQFQAVNSDARLAEIFAGLRQRNLDLSPVLFFEPKLIRAPTVQDNGILRMTGFLDTKPERVLFDMGFESVEGQWRLSAIVVDVQPSPPESAPAKQPEKSAAKPNAKADASTKSKGKADQPTP